MSEVHNFIGEERGTQLISLLERLQKLTGDDSCRIGLSAHLGYRGCRRLAKTAVQKESASLLIPELKGGEQW